jgi:hypothetical protein
MSDATPRFLLPFILPGQAQKEQFHNEALTRADAIMHPAVEGASLGAPPPAPQPGQCWIAAEAASGLWAGRDLELAVWTEGGWRFAAPQPGMLIWDKSAGRHLHWDGIVWDPAVATSAVRIGGVQVVGPRLAAVPSPSGGAIIDAEARAAIGAVIAALMSHGLIE